MSFTRRHTSAAAGPAAPRAPELCRAIILVMSPSTLIRPPRNALMAAWVSPSTRMAFACRTEGQRQVRMLEVTGVDLQPAGGGVDVGVDDPVAERHVVYHLVHPDAHRNGGNLVLELGPDLAGLFEPFVAQERVLSHRDHPLLRRSTGDRLHAGGLLT